MDPVGPWSAYPYNRLAAGVQATTNAGELHHLTAPGAAPTPSTTTAQIIPGSFLSPPPVGYEVFSPLFHHAAAGTKPATHYVTQVAQQRAQALVQAQASAKQPPDTEYHPAQAFFDQGAGAWQQNSPFGILPHESVVATTTSKNTVYETFNAQFAAAQSLNQLNSQLVAASVKTAARSQSPQVSTAKTTAAVTYFQVPSTFTVSESANTKSFSTANSSNLQQTCIVTSPSVTVTKEYRVPQGPTRTFISSPNTTATRPVTQPPKPPQQQQQPPQGQIQTKAQTKIYPELSAQSERQRSNEEHGQSSPISFSIIEAPVRYTATNSSAPKRTAQYQHTNFRQYQQPSTAEQDFQRPKSGPDYSSSNGPDCNVVVPRRPSPLQAHSQASPLGHAPSPVYPLYNSPMNSISSPQQSNSNQVTPPSPLDVSVPRPNSQNTNVAYPSVITRALNTEKTFSERYDRNNQQNQNCWDERQQQSRKFQANQSNVQSNNYSSNSIETPSRQIELTNRTEQTGQRPVPVAINERQQTYFDSNNGQIQLQDLSSCRGDPMTIVKNLQQQQSCQIPQTEIKQEIKPPAKRRKSSEKVITVPATETAGRIPPPAHSSGVNPQQQNGAYFDFDRWNLPTPPTKIFTTQAIHQQHQGLMVPHPHGPHPIPYFPPFHLAPPPTEFQNSVELTPVPTYGEQQQSPQPTTSQYNQPEEHPKVVVPNIEEELNFLAGGTVRAPSSVLQKSTTANSIGKPLDKPSGPNMGFMSSYLKFLQGERDSSPPPAVRGGRKQTWIKPKTEALENKTDTNGIPPAPQPPPPLPTPKLSQGDPQDDPRYFPLPKERKRNSFDSSDDGFSSEDDFFSKRIMTSSHDSKSKEKTGRRGGRPKSAASAEKKKQKQLEMMQKKLERERQKELKKEKKEKVKEDKVKIITVESVPRRESVKRAAKEKLQNQKLKGDEDVEDPPDFVDSDTDPAWTPAAKEEEEEIPLKKTKRSRQSGGVKKRGTRNLIAAAAQGAGINVTEDYATDIVPNNHKKRKTGGRHKQIPPTLEDNIAASLSNKTVSETSPYKSNRLREKQHQPGEFVVLKDDLKQEWPSIWRVDGKNLLQKYESFEQDGRILYRNISTYTSWTPESKKQYTSVPVKYHSQSQLETIVEFLKKEMVVIDYEYQEKCMKDFESYQDNFEVYIQTLISQALDSNFLTEIFQEKDEYFLSNVKTIDDITDSKKNKLLSLLKWPHSVQSAVCTWPCFNVISEINVADAQNKRCAACTNLGVSVRVLMYGQPYNSTTLEGCPPDPNAINEKDFFMCKICANRVSLTNKITHQKYLMYIECAKRVGEKRTSDPNKDTTCILNELLADENWLNQLFLEVRTSWSEVDCIEYSYKMRNNTVI